MKRFAIVAVLFIFVAWIIDSVLRIFRGVTAKGELSEPTSEELEDYHRMIAQELPLEEEGQ